MGLASPAEWSIFLKAHPNAHLLQLGEWGELKSAFGWEAVRLVSDDGFGAQILFRRLPLGLTIGYMPKPVFSGRIAEGNDGFWDEVDRVCRLRRAVFLKVEPDLWDGGAERPPRDWILSSHNIQPPRTIILDIEAGEEQILARMRQKCRYNIRLAVKKGVTVRPWRDLRGFHEMMSITGERDRFGVHALDYYRRAFDLFHPRRGCELLIAEFEGRPLAALMVFAHGRRAWYVYGASNDLERNRMPTYLLQWEAIRWAMHRGCAEYDLWGVPDEEEQALEAGFESRSEGLWGVYRFKRGFGGRLVRSAQALDRVYNPLMYRLYLWRMASREGG
jgi:lipid II:glycine glycyltransferase (peptidoglycan interpeptide bridge formation enzyme)